MGDSGGRGGGGGESKGYVRPEHRPILPGGRAEVPQRVMNVMMKPIIFGNHQTAFKLFSYGVSAAVVYYCVFHLNWGPHEHCFTWIRKKKDEKMKQFFTVDPNDPELQKLREKKPNMDSSSVSKV